MMLINQEKVYSELKKYAECDRHNILITGIEGCGKTYIAKLYAKELGIDDFHIVEPKIANIKETMDMCIGLTTPCVICIENLDLGVNAVSYAILKFIEEPADNVYIVITCRNIKEIPDTILSRCLLLSLSPITESDLIAYAENLNSAQYSVVKKDNALWKCIKSIDDIELLFGLNSLQIGYFKTIQGIIGSKDSVSNMVWKLQKFPDETATPIKLIIRYIMYSIENKAVFSACHSCLMALSNGRLGSHAVLAKFAFEIKYLTV